MKYFRPNTIDELFAYLEKYADKAIPVSGGTFFLGHREELFNEVEALIDISEVGLDYIRVDDEGLKIGATTTLTSLMTSARINRGIFKVLSETVSQISPNEVRNMGTVGGNICIAAEMDLPIPLIALDGKVIIASASGTTTLPLEKFYLGYLTNALKVGEIVTEIQIPHFPPKTAAAFHKFRRRGVDIPVVNAAARVTLGPDDKCTEAKIAVGSIEVTPVVADSAAKLLEGNALNSKIIARAAEIATDIECLTDMRASGELRKIWGKIAVEAALNRAYEKAQGGGEK